jgi:hypothetical protein
MKPHQAIKPAPAIDAVVHYAEALLDLRFKSVRKNRYGAPCPFHADTKDGFQVYVNKHGKVYRNEKQRQSQEVSEKEARV